MSSARKRVLTLFAAISLVVTFANVGAAVRQDKPPAEILGSFTDDYGSVYKITEKEWAQGSRARYHIVRWNVAAKFAIAQNDSANPSDANLWTRIDWIELQGMPPYTWAYCYSAFRAASAAVAETVSAANRTTPRTGCNGFPFSRMRPSPPS